MTLEAKAQMEAVEAAIHHYHDSVQLLWGHALIAANPSNQTELGQTVAGFLLSEQLKAVSETMDRAFAPHPGLAEHMAPSMQEMLKVMFRETTETISDGKFAKLL